MAAWPGTWNRKRREKRKDKVRKVTKIVWNTWRHTWNAICSALRTIPGKDLDENGTLGTLEEGEQESYRGGYGNILTRKKQTPSRIIGVQVVKCSIRSKTK